MKQRTILTCGVLMISALCDAQAPVDLKQFDGLSLGLSESDFLQARPEARYLKRSKDDSLSKYFLYQPANAKLFGHTVIGAGRGFEAGRGCAVGVSFGEVSMIEIPQLLGDVATVFRGDVSRRVDSAGNEWRYFTSADFFGSAMLAKAVSGAPKQEVTLVWSSKQCDVQLAANRWQTLNR